jgi:3-phosphoshikimate 1-carboxyvinyltransferase
VRLTVHPGPPLQGRFAPPGDKSITHRALLLALLAEGESRIAHANPGEDCASTRHCAEALGLEVVSRGRADAPGTMTLCGRGATLTEPRTVLECGNSGTTLRLLAGVVAGQPFLSVLSGDASLNRRPVERVITPLRAMGAELHARDQDRHPPLVIHGAALKAIRHALPVASAQVASCVLLAGLFANGTTEVTLPGPARDHTERMLPACGVPIEREARSDGGRRVAVQGPSRVSPISLRVPGDFSAAAFFLAIAAATPGARVTAADVNLNPTRTGLLETLAAMGATVETRAVRLEGGEETGDVTVTGAEMLSGFDVPAEWLPRMIDEVPALAVAAALARGTTRISGASELRVKESDRLAAIAANLARLGITARERPDGLEIEGGTVQGGNVASRGDHRVAMAFATLGAAARAPITVDDAASIATSYPGFAGTLADLGGVIEPARGRVAAR